MIPGRGLSQNPAHRFTEITYEPDPEYLEWVKNEEHRPPTRYFRDQTRSIISWNDSPDIPFRASVNPYRGCEHGCAYCYARPFHEYLELSPGLDFETKILVKEDAPKLLWQELSRKTWQPQPVLFSGATDPYQPIERQLKLTRQCLEVLAEFRNPVALITKNQLITRDIDLLQELAKYHAVSVKISITTLDPHVVKILEPRTTAPHKKLETISKLAQADIPVGVSVAPIIPAINDHEIPRILEAASNAGATSAFYILVRLPFSMKTLFSQWLAEHFPERREKVLNRIRAMKKGQLNRSEFGERFKGSGIFASQIQQLFDTTCKKHGIKNTVQNGSSTLSTAAFRRVTPYQLSLFPD